MSSFFPPSQPCFRQGRYDLEAAQLPIGGPGLGLKATEIQLKALPRGRSWNGISMLQKPKRMRYTLFNQQKYGFHGMVMNGYNK